MNKELIKKGYSILKSSGYSVLYMTADGQFFDKMPNAINNANTLENKEILVINKDTILDEEDKEVKQKKIKNNGTTKR